MLRALLCLAVLALASGLTLRMGPSKTIAIFGGTGGVGRECVYQALKDGNNVVILARDPSKLLTPERVTGSGGAPITDPKLHVIQGNVCEAADVNKVYQYIASSTAPQVQGTIVALGGKTKDVGKTMLTDGTTNIIQALKTHNGGKRIAVVTSIGAGDSENQAPLVFKALMYTVMRSIFEDKNRQEKLFVDSQGPGSDLEWTVIRPGGLGLGEPTGVINVIDGQAGSIQRSDVAAFCLGAVCDESFKYLRKTPCISSVGGIAWVKEPKAGFDGVNTA